MILYEVPFQVGVEFLGGLCRRPGFFWIRVDAEDEVAG